MLKSTMSVSRNVGGEATRVGFIPSDKKKPVIRHLIQFAKTQGIDIFTVDLSKPLAEQGPMDFIIHKLTKHLLLANAGDASSKILIEDLQDFLSINPGIQIIDPLPNLAKVIDRKIAMRLLSNISCSRYINNNGYTADPTTFHYEVAKMNPSVESATRIQYNLSDKSSKPEEKIPKTKEKDNIIKPKSLKKMNDSYDSPKHLDPSIATYGVQQTLRTKLFSVPNSFVSSTVKLISSATFNNSFCNGSNGNSHLSDNIRPSDRGKIMMNDTLLLMDENGGASFRGLCHFPVLIKRTEACSTSNSHEMVLVRSKSEMLEFLKYHRNKFNHEIYRQNQEPDRHAQLCVNQKPGTHKSDLDHPFAFDPDESVMVQEFINHSGFLYKVYVVGDLVHVQVRPSFCNINSLDYTNSRQPLYFNSQVIPKTFFKTQSPDNLREAIESSGEKPSIDLTVKKKQDILDAFRKDYSESELNALLAKVDQNRVEQIAKALKEEFCLSIFGFDFLIRSQSSSSKSSSGKTESSLMSAVVNQEEQNWIVVDINYFPSFNGLPGFNEEFVKLIRTKNQQK